MKKAVRLTHGGLKVVALKDSDNPGVPSGTVQDCKKAQDLLAEVMSLLPAWKVPMR